MVINERGISLIKEFEGLKLEVYKDIVGVLTVGYGHVTSMSLGTKITLEEAEKLLKQDLIKFESGVTSLLTVPVPSNAFSALVCFAFNLGLGNLKQSMLLRCINKHNMKDAANEFLKWNHAGGCVVDGLTRRRKAERDLFLLG